MQIIISSLLLILALHFLLQGINYRKTIYLNKTSNMENFECIPESTKIKMELLNKIQCENPSVLAFNTYTDNTNDANFQSNVLNTNRFYVKNDGVKKDNSNEVVNQNEINSLSDVKYSNQPDSWKYKNELVMNGGELLSGITGYDNIMDDYYSYNKLNVKSECNPSDRGATLDDDLRMGMGTTNKDIRNTT